METKKDGGCEIVKDENNGGPRQVGGTDRAGDKPA